MRGKGWKDTKKGWLERQNKQDGVDIREGEAQTQDGQDRGDQQCDVLVVVVVVGEGVGHPSALDPTL